MINRHTVNSEGEMDGGRREGITNNNEKECPIYVLQRLRSKFMFKHSLANRFMMNYCGLAEKDR